MKEQITELTHPSMYAWFTEYLDDYKDILDKPDNGLKDGKLEFKKNYIFRYKLPYIKYPYINVNYFDVAETNIMFLINSSINLLRIYCFNSSNLLSFKGFPKKVNEDVFIWNNYYEQYSLNYKKDKYKLYLAMWLEMLDSVTEKERWEYINEFKGKKNYISDYSVIPKELLLEFGVM